MISFSMKEPMAINATAAWAQLSDIVNIASFHPEVEESYVVGKVMQGLGTRAVWLFKNNSGNVIEEITQFEEGRSYTVSFIEGSIPVGSADTQFSIYPENEQQCSVQVNMTFKLKGGMLGALFGRWVFKPMLKRRMTHLLAALEVYVQESRQGDQPTQTTIVD